MVRAGVAYAGHCPDCLFLALFFNVFQWGRGYCFYFGVEGGVQNCKGDGPPKGKRGVNRRRGPTDPNGLGEQQNVWKNHHVPPNVLLLSQSAWIRVSSQRVSAIKKITSGAEGPRRLFTSRFSYTFYCSPKRLLPSEDMG